MFAEDNLLAQIFTLLASQVLTFAFLCKIVNTAHILSLAKSNIRIFTNNMHYTTSFSNNNITSLQKKILHSK